MTLRFTAAGRRALGRARKARLALALTFRPVQGSAVKASAVATLKR